MSSVSAVYEGPPIIHPVDKKRSMEIAEAVARLVTSLQPAGEGCLTVVIHPIYWKGPEFTIQLSLHSLIGRLRHYTKETLKDHKSLSDLKTFRGILSGSEMNFAEESLNKLVAALRQRMDELL